MFETAAAEVDAAYLRLKTSQNNDNVDDENKNKSSDEDDYKAPVLLDSVSTGRVSNVTFKSNVKISDMINSTA